jgi:hypothetical protein
VVQHVSHIDEGHDQIPTKNAIKSRATVTLESTVIRQGQPQGPREALQRQACSVASIHLDPLRKCSERLLMG